MANTKKQLFYIKLKVVNFAVGMHLEVLAVVVGFAIRTVETPFNYCSSANFRKSGKSRDFSARKFYQNPSNSNSRLHRVSHPRYKQLALSFDMSIVGGGVGAGAGA